MKGSRFSEEQIIEICASSKRARRPRRSVGRPAGKKRLTPATRRAAAAQLINLRPACDIYQEVINCPPLGPINAVGGGCTHLLETRDSGVAVKTSARLRHIPGGYQLPAAGSHPVQFRRAYPCCGSWSPWIAVKQCSKET